MATVSRRGYTPWQGSGKSWPSGTAPGDLAVMVRMAPGSYSSPPSSLASWRQVGRFVVSVGGSLWPLSWHVEAWVRTLTSADISASPPDTYGQVTVLTGAAGTGTVRTGLGFVRVQPGGAALTVSYTESDSASDMQSGPSWQTPAGKVTQPSWLGPVPVRAVVGCSTSSGGGVVGVPGSWGDSMALEVLPAQGPAAPTVLSPSDGQEVPSTGAVDFGWQHRPVLSGGFQDAYRLRIDAGGGWRYWNASTSALSSSEVTNSSSVQAASVPASLLTAAVGHVWQVQTREGLDGQWSDWSSASSFTPVTPPSVTLTAPGASVHDDLTPTVSWSATTPRGSQTAFQVQIVESTSAAVVHDSRVRPGAATSYTVPVQDWTNGMSYTARARVQQTGGAWSAWATTTFTLSWTAPAAPTVTAVPGSRGVEVTVEVTSPMSVTLERIGTDGLWTPVVSARDAAPGAPLVVTDVFAHYLAPTAYRAQGITVLDGQWLRSPWAMSDPVASSDRHGAYLALAANPTDTWARVTITALDHGEEHEPVTTTYGLGDTHGRVTYGPQQGQAGSITLDTATDAARDTVLRMLSAQEPMLLRLPPEMDPAGNWSTGALLTLARSSQVTTERYGVAPSQSRKLSFSWVEQPEVVLDGTVELPARTPAISVVGDVVVFG